MSDNPHPAPAQDFRLPSHHVLALVGRDAVAFAQAQCMNDVAALGDGQWQWNGWLTPKGRVIALFALLRLDSEALWLILPDVDAGALATQLQRFVFRSKLKLEPRGDLHAVATFGPPVAASGSMSANVDGAVELDMSADGGSRRLRIASTDAAPDDALASRWRGFDIAHGLPRLDAEQVDAWTPQQLSLERLRAFSVKKGCYPGQEIVARTHFLGKVKRVLMRLQGDGVNALDEVMDGEPVGPGVQTVRPIGQLICAEGDEGLAVMPVDAGDGPFATGNLPCARLPLLEGLAR